MDQSDAPYAHHAAGTAGPGTQPPHHIAHAARALFGDRLPLARRYAWLLSTQGVARGLIGPRESARIWDRHLLNCAAVAELIPTGATVTDVGSGAGLPGVALAIGRPDLRVTLVESLARRTAFLDEVVADLDLSSRVRVLRARAEECAGASRGYDLAPAEIVTARALAPLDRLAGWCLPLTAMGGRVIAIKGAGAAGEVVAHRDAVARAGGSAPVVRHCGVGLIDPPTTVIEIVRVGAVRGSGARTRRTRTGRRKSTSDVRGPGTPRGG